MHAASLSSNLHSRWAGGLSSPDHLRALVTASVDGMLEEHADLPGAGAP